MLQHRCHKIAQKVPATQEKDPYALFMNPYIDIYPEREQN
jgi:hypothetical protein